VEHVIEALERLCAESADAAGEESRIPPAAAAVLTLQSMQLADAGTKFAASVASVAGNLERIAAEVLNMAAESRVLSGLSEDETNSFFVEMERGCTTILSSLGQCTEAETAIQETRRELAETVGRMRGPIQEIRVIELQVERMALNAGVRANHLGTAGNALSVLAGALQRLAVDCRERSEMLSHALGTMGDAATGLSGQGGLVFASNRDESDDVLDGIRRAVAHLSSASERSFAQILQITARGAQLSENLTGSSRSFSVGAVFAETIGRVRRQLQGLGDAHPPNPLGGSSESAHSSLGGFTRHYTMQAEREVHADATRLMAGAPVAVLEEPPEMPQSDTGELGENVEFF
jgi:hypothetical protein